VVTVTDPLTPPAVAVITAESTGPGVQIVGVVVESHFPAQIAPLVLTSTTLGLLLDQVGVRLVMGAPLESTIVALSAVNRPTSSDGFDGLIVSDAAVGVFDLLLLPQPAIRPAMRAKTATA
jgi:hypothetical protein